MQEEKILGKKNPSPFNDKPQNQYFLKPCTSKSLFAAVGLFLFCFLFFLLIFLFHLVMGRELNPKITVVFLEINEKLLIFCALSVFEFISANHDFSLRTSLLINTVGLEPK